MPELSLFAMTDAKEYINLIYIKKYKRSVAQKNKIPYVRYTLVDKDGEEHTMTMRQDSLIEQRLIKQLAHIKVVHYRT